MPRQGRAQQTTSVVSRWWWWVGLLLVCAAGKSLALDLSIEQARSALQGSSDKLRAAAEDINRRELDAKAAEKAEKAPKVPA